MVWGYDHRVGERVAVYIDGFNLYFGLDAAGLRNLLWLDIPLFAQNMLKQGQELVSVKYFTTRVAYPAASVKRQSTFLDALTHRGGLEIISGNFIYNPNSCDACGHEWDRREEKQTDVNIALHMTCDSIGGAFDAAILVSGDSDLVPVVKFIEQRDGQRVVVMFPPARVSTDLQDAASSHSHLKKKIFVDSQMPMLVNTPAHVLAQPVQWSDHA
jgi:uncharacterized LabA/DUF88 family protein